MKEQISYIISFTTIIIYSGLCLADPIDDIDIYFINGINNTPAEAVESAEYTSNLIVRPHGKVVPLYNLSHQLIFDLIETYRLSSSGDLKTELFWQYLVNPRMLSDTQRSNFDSIFAQIYPSYVNNLPWTAEEDFNNMTTNILSSLNANRPVLIVGHSEGNLFGNRLVNSIKAQNSNYGENCLRVVSVATPDTHVVNNGPWTTGTSDLVIALARISLQSHYNILQDNVVTSWLDSAKVGDVLSHGYIETYLNQTTTKNKIRNDIYNQAQDLVSKCDLSPPPQPLTCGSPITPSGGKGTYHFPYTFTGSSSQTIDVSFEAFHIPDRLTVKAGGSTLADTNNYVSGFHRFRINVDPARRGNTVNLTVNAPNDGTAWVLCADCEDSGTSCLNALGRKKVTASISWTTPIWDCNINSQTIDGVAYTGNILKTYLTPGRHEYKFDGVCVCTTYLSCGTGAPKLLIDGKSYNLPGRWSPLFFNIK